MDEYSQLLLTDTESETDSQGSLDLDATQGPSGSTQDFTYSQDTRSPESSITVESPKKASDPAAKPRKRQINHFLAVGNPTDSDSDIEQSQSLLKRRKSTKKGKSTQTVFTGSFATNTSCIIFDEDALVEVVNVNEKKTQTHVFGTILGLSSNIYYKF
nr:uncharacterized protein LOC117689010 isoform X1 [Crassostrea gigas]